MTQHKKRLFAGIIALLVFFTSLVHHVLFFPFLVLVSFLLYSEYFKMFQNKVASPYTGVLGFWIHTGMLIILYGLLLHNRQIVFPFFSEHFYSWNLLFFIPVLIYAGIIIVALFHIFWFEKKSFADSLMISVLSIVYLSVPMLCLLYLFMRSSMIFFLIPFLVVWINDSTAYYIGSHWGKRKIAPNISPNKTYLGTFGSVVATTALISLLKIIWRDFPLSLWQIVGFVPLFCLIAHIGDFTESGMKRVMNIKDSGTLMPGHGGVLDRVDSLLFILTVYVFLVPLFI